MLRLSSLALGLRLMFVCLFVCFQVRSETEVSSSLPWSCFTELPDSFTLVLVE